MVNELRQDVDLSNIEAELYRLILQEEAVLGEEAKSGGPLWNHLQRTARLARELGRAEGLDRQACYLGGLFHDAGKFATFRAGGKTVEEEKSADILLRLGADSGLNPCFLLEIEGALRQLYSRDVTPSPLAKVVHDADNFDKLGAVGIANFFVKCGLRGRGVSLDLLLGLTKELNYARYSEQRFLTEAGRRQARPRAKETILFIENFVSAFSRDHGCEIFRELVDFEGVPLELISPARCQCAGDFTRSVWGEAGLKCREVHVEYFCQSCGADYSYKFCCPVCPEKFTP